MLLWRMRWLYALVVKQISLVVDADASATAHEYEEHTQASFFTHDLFDPYCSSGSKINELTRVSWNFNGIFWFITSWSN